MIYPIMIYQWIGCPNIILKTPKAMAKPTESATVSLSKKASILPLLIAAALSAIAIKAGSATVVEKPIKNANSKSQNIEPFFANSWANPSPRGNIPISRPRIKIARPKRTIERPIITDTVFSGICCSIRS